jgi:phosphatidylglycerophosphatase A
MRFSADPKVVLKNPIHFLAFGFGAGLSPYAPGTMGTIVAIPIVWFLSQLSLICYLCIVVMFSVAGIFLCGASAKRLNVHDHSGIVWDEIVGYAITMIALPHDWKYFLAGFVLFRVFDITKPWPIREADHRLKGGLGIMLDDVMAGLVSCALLHMTRHLLN